MVHLLRFRKADGAAGGRPSGLQAVRVLPADTCCLLCAAEWYAAQPELAVVDLGVTGTKDDLVAWMARDANPYAYLLSDDDTALLRFLYEAKVLTFS